jgi:sugar lactone lactonase YvrE
VVSNEAGVVSSDAALLTVYGGAVPDDYLFTTLAGEAEQHGTDDGSGSAARFNQPMGIEVDSAGNLYVADTVNHTVRKITAAGQVTTLAGTPGVIWTAEAPQAESLLYSPNDVAVDAAGNVFVADTDTHSIRKITPAGTISYFAGQAGTSGTNDGLGLAARFNRPTGLAVDSEGNLFVADSDNFTLRKITPGGSVSTIAGRPGETGYQDGGTNEALFNWPFGIAVDQAGSLYVTEYYAYTVRKVHPSGSVWTLAGEPGRPGVEDGPGNEARFIAPAGVAVDGDGNAYVTEYGLHTLRKITPDGVVLTVAGLSEQRGTNDGLASAVRFNGPSGVTVGPAGTLYVADTDNATIRKGIKTPAPEPPLITGQPKSRSASVGSTVTLTVEVSGTDPLHYSWRKGGNPLLNATNAVLTLTNVQTSDAGLYSVVVTNALGSATSTAAALTITPSPVALRIVTMEGQLYVTNQTIHLQIAGAVASQPLVIEASSDLKTWEAVYTNAAPGEPVEIMHALPGNQPGRFFRARQP